jgi:hypothetical protein
MHFGEFCAVLEETKVRNLRLRRIELGPLAVLQLQLVLETAYGGTIRWLDLSANNLGDEGKTMVCEMTSNTQHLERLTMDFGKGSHVNKKELRRSRNGQPCEINFSENWLPILMRIGSCSRWM